MQLKTGQQVGVMMRNSIAAKATRMLALLRRSAPCTLAMKCPQLS
jgi:hypothetical protein